MLYRTTVAFREAGLRVQGCGFRDYKVLRLGLNWG